MGSDPMLAMSLLRYVKWVYLANIYKIYKWICTWIILYQAC